MFSGFLQRRSRQSACLRIRQAAQSIAQGVALAALAAWTLASSASADDAWPVADRETKPWTRWWWHGSAVNDADITKQLEAYAAAGIGGVEITPIYGVRGTEDLFLPYLEAGWMDALEHTLREAERLDLGVDMATGNGWPFGGPWVEADTACRNLVLETYELKGGERLEEPIRHEQRPMARAIGRRVSIEELVEPIRANEDLQGLALEQVRFPKPLPLAALVAESQDGTHVHLTDKVADDGTLDWIAPPGRWKLYAAFSGWHGKMVERAGPGGEGNVIDHFSAAALEPYLARFDEAFAGRDIASMRGFFNDSYEVDDAAGEADWTPEFFAEFEKRRGYDLRDELPTLAARDDEERLGRILCDYRETISDLLLEEFTKPWDDWAARHQAITRNQSHGSPGNLLDLYAASDIPETEGTDRIKFMTAASAAHVAGKRLASAEACTWMDERFLGTLAETKRWVDDYFLGGVNHICYHGTPYTPADDPWPGWMFYASVHYGTTNSWWPHFHALNEYVARCQSFLQAGQPDNDVLVYYPIHDQWSQPGRSRLVHFDGSMQGNAARKCAQWLLDGGYLLDFISDAQLAGVEVDGEELTVGGNRYKAVVVPECSLIPATTLEKLAELVEAGATVVFDAKLPEGVPGLGDLDERQEEFDDSLARLAPAEDDSPRLGEVRRVERGRVVVGEPTAALAAAGVEAEQLAKQNLTFIRRKLPDGYVYFIRNDRDAPFVGAVTLREQGLVAIFEPLTGKSGLAAGTRLQLAPQQTCLLRVFAPSRSTAMRSLGIWKYASQSGAGQTIDGPWLVEFMDGGPERPDSAEIDQLTSWTELPDQRAAAFSGTVRYTTQLDPAAVQRIASQLVLDLGEVHESAAVSVNGKHVATLFAPPYRVTLDADDLKPSGNTLEVEVANLMANRIAALEQSGDTSFKKYYNINFPPKPDRNNPNRGRDGLFTAKDWKPRPSGLLGPVTLTPVRITPPTEHEGRRAAPLPLHHSTRQRERLDRGVVVLPTAEGAMVSWRLLADDPADVAFHVTRRGPDGKIVELGGGPFDGPTFLIDDTLPEPDGNDYVYTVAVAGEGARENVATNPGSVAWPRTAVRETGSVDSHGRSGHATHTTSDRVAAPVGKATLHHAADAADYLSIPVEPPFGYQPGDASVGDLDGDGQYEIVVHMVGTGRDNSQDGFTTPPWLHAYKLTGERLWAINLGANIREGAHYTQFMVYDLDGDGRAEVACKTADGTVDGVGNVIGDAEADYVNRAGRILEGPEFLTVFDGPTGAALATVDYIPPRGNVRDWGDNRANRADRFLACMAYLDGQRPSLVMCRGYYTRAVLAAWDFRDGHLTHRWTFDSDDGTPGNRDYRGQGNHNLSVGDVDGDGRDEIVYGSCVIDDDGAGLYSTGFGHGDAMHLADHIPGRPGLEVFKCNGDGPNPAGLEMRDAATGEQIWALESSGRDGVVRACAIDLDPRFPGSECWGSGRGVGGLRTAAGELITGRQPRAANMGVWWDGDPQRELLNGVTVAKWDPAEERERVLFEGRAFGVESINGSKSNPCLCADILGDWREEIIAPTRDGRELRIFVAAEPTPYRLPTLMHDPVYRLGVAWQNVSYNQPAHLSFDLAERLAEPAATAGREPSQGPTSSVR